MPAASIYWNKLSLAWQPTLMLQGGLLFYFHLAKPRSAEPVFFLSLIKLYYRLEKKRISSLKRTLMLKDLLKQAVLGTY